MFCADFKVRIEQFSSASVELFRQSGEGLVQRVNSFQFMPPLADETKLASSWKQFTEKFPTDRDCLDELYNRLVIKDCRHCRSLEVDRNHGHRMLRCRSCNRKTSLTAHTFFHGVKKFQAWLGAIWLFEAGMLFNASILARLSGIAYATAHHIFTKISMVIDGCMEGESVPSLLFSSVVGKRSRETPARAHPIAEEEELAKCPTPGMELPTEPLTAQGETDNQMHSWTEQEEDNGNGPALPGGVDTLNADEKRVLACLSDNPVQFDELCARSGLLAGPLSAVLILLELNGSVLRMAGNFYARNIKHSARERTLQRQSRKAMDAINLLIASIRMNYHAISRKYLQLYLAALWCFIDRVRWPRGSLIMACLEVPYIGPEEMLHYVSPLSVRLAL